MPQGTEAPGAAPSRSLASSPQAGQSIQMNGSTLIFLYLLLGDGDRVVKTGEEHLLAFGDFGHGPGSPVPGPIAERVRGPRNRQHLPAADAAGNFPLFHFYCLLT